MASASLPVTFMFKRNVPSKSGRVRGRGLGQATRAQNKQRISPRSRMVSAAGDRQKAAVPKPSSMGAEGRRTLGSPSTRRMNLSNVKRKPAARGRAKG